MSELRSLTAHVSVPPRRGYSSVVGSTEPDPRFCRSVQEVAPRIRNPRAIQRQLSPFFDPRASTPS